MTRKLMFLLSILFIYIGLITAQTSRVEGIITSEEDGEPIIGATVLVKGTTIGTVTGANGKFELTRLPSSAKTLQISFVGMKAIEVPIQSGLMQLTLRVDAQLIDEVMVVAYGTAKKSSFTGSAATIKGEKIAKLQTSNISKSLEGTVAGVQLSSSTGQPGSGANIIIRGLGSISASQSPLIVLDGVPYEGSLNSISTQDIENLTVLKDAAANSMYGARGSNGVILITTKKGQEGKAKVNFEARVGWNTRGVSAYDVMESPKDYYETYWDGIRNYALVNDFSAADAAQYATNNLISGSEGLVYNIYKGIADNALVGIDGRLNSNATVQKWNESWLKEPFKAQPRQEYNVNISGAKSGTSYYLSFGYLNDKGYIKNSDFERFSARVKVDQEIGKYIKVGGNLAYVNTSQNAPSTSNTAYSNLFMFSQNIAPIYPVYLHDMTTGEIMYDDKGQKRYDFGTENGRLYASQQNPMATNVLDIVEYNRDNISLRGYGEVNFLKDFKFTLNISYDIFNINNTNFSNPKYGDSASLNGWGSKTFSRTGALNINQLLNYNKSFGKNTLNVLLGHETKADETRQLYGTMTNFVDPDNPELANGAKYNDLSSDKTTYHLEGYFARAEYNFDEKYYLSASFRRDGSSVFHPDVRWGSFWSVGGSWRLSQEKFMKNLTWINDLKIKASYGTQGNDNILDADGYRLYQSYTDLYSINRIDGRPGFSLWFRGNPNLTWEKSNNFNAGTEFRIFDILSVNVDFFIKETKDMLYKSPLAASEGNPSWIYRNEMDMKNTGIEFDITANIINRTNFKWDVSLNGTHYKNQLTRLPEDKDQNGYASGSFWRKKGNSLYDYYTYEYAGVDQETGLPLYNKYTKDANGNETVSTVNTTGEASLRQIHKSSIPDFYGGLSTSLMFYGFDFSVQTAFQLGGYVWDSVYSGFMGSGDNGQNYHKDMLKRWTPENPTSNIPRVEYANVEINGSADRWLTSASYFSLRNITLGYTLPKKLTRKILVDNLRVYFVADNVFLASARKGLDPRQSFSGSVYNSYSALRTTSFGLSLSF